MDSTMPEKEFLARRGRKSLIPLRAGAREGVMRMRNMCPDHNLSVRRRYPKNSDDRRAGLFGLDY